MSSDSLRGATICESHQDPDHALGPPILSILADDAAQTGSDTIDRKLPLSRLLRRHHTASSGTMVVLAILETRIVTMQLLAVSGQHETIEAVSTVPRRDT